MDGHEDEAPVRTGRLHGRLLKILAAVSVLVALVAVWQLGPTVLQGEEEVAATWPWEDPSTVDFSDDEPTTEPAADTAEASTTSAEPSPEKSSAEPESPPASDEPAPTTEAAESAAEPEPEPEGPECTASLEVVNEWRGAMEVWVRVHNTGTGPIDGWEITIDLDDADVYESWGMRHVDGDRYESADWNGGLDAGEAADAGFQAATEDHHWDEVDVPDTVPCKALRD